MEKIKTLEKLKWKNKNPEFVLMGNGQRLYFFNRFKYIFGPYKISEFWFYFPIKLVNFDFSP